MNFFYQHPFVLPVVMMVYSAAIGALPAPTAQSKPFYRWFFSFSNTLAANFVRAFGPKVENSPNFLAAVNIHNQQKTNGGSQGDEIRPNN